MPAPANANTHRMVFLHSPVYIYRWLYCLTLIHTYRSIEPWLQCYERTWRTSIHTVHFWVAFGLHRNFCRKERSKKHRTHHTQYFGVEKNVRIRPRNWSDKFFHSLKVRFIVHNWLSAMSLHILSYFWTTTKIDRTRTCSAFVMHKSMINITVSIVKTTTHLNVWCYHLMVDTT